MLHCHTATGTHMPSGITRCYLPPDTGDIPAFTPSEAGTRLSDPKGTQGWFDLDTAVKVRSPCPRLRITVACATLRPIPPQLGRPHVIRNKTTAECRNKITVFAACILFRLTCVYGFSNERSNPRPPPETQPFAALSEKSSNHNVNLRHLLWAFFDKY